MNTSRRELFEAANYQKLIDSWFLDPYLIGALVFLGRVQEAREYARKIKSPADKVECSFYLLLASVRALSFKEIIEDLGALFKFYNLCRKHTSRFYLHQALGIVRYYRGEFQKSQEQTNRAFKIALDLDSQYFCMLANDLNAHALCMREDYAKGLKKFDDSIRFAKKIKNNSNVSVIELSKMSYKINAGMELTKAKEQLESWIKNIRPQDYFTQTNALLLRAKLFLLAGNLQLAEKSLFEVSVHVYRNNHGRQILEYNLLMAQLSLLLNRPERTLPLIRTSLQLCAQGHDLYFQLRFKELELSAHKHISSSDIYSDDLKVEIHSLAQKAGRKPRFRYPELIIPEELVDHHLRAANRSPTSRSEKYSELSELALLGIVLVLYKDERENFIDWRLPRRELLFFTGKNLELIKGLTSNQLELIRLLTTRLHWSKRELVESFWRLNYDPFLHDNKIYITLKRLRNRLGEEVKFFELQRGSVLIEDISNIADNSPQLTSEISLNINDDRKYNLRQLKWLAENSSGTYIKPLEYAQLFGISRNTSSRDLSSLEEMGAVKGHGHGPSRFFQIL